MRAKTLGAVVGSVLGCLCAGASLAQVVPLGLLVESVEAAPDSAVNVIVRTVADHPLASVAFAIEARERSGLPILPFASLIQATAYSGADDAVVSAVLDPATQRTEVSVTSASATLNDLYGPLVVLRFQLNLGIAENTRFEMQIDPDTTVVAADASPLPTLAGRGRLRLRTPDPGLGLMALGDDFFPGEIVVFGAATPNPLPIGGGTIELLYDPSFADGPPVVKIDPRYGSGSITAVSEPVPGQILVTFESPDGDLNADLHGLFLSVAIPSRADVPVGTLVPLGLGPATALVDPDGLPIALELDGDPVQFVPPELLLAAAFEAGDLLEFWNVVN